MLQAELESPAGVGTLLDADVPADWPPGEYDRGAIAFIHKELSANWPAMDGWSAWYALRTPVAGTRAVLVGSGGFFGPPDAHGTVEIGYSISDVWRKQGFATELVTALLWRAAESAQVRCVYAQVSAANIASHGVLRKAGFEEVAATEPDVLRFEYTILTA